MRGCLLWAAIFLLWPYDSSQKECKEPDDVDFGEIISDEKARYLENDRVQYECNSGYVLDGSEWILCNGQEWTPPPPKCLAPCSITKQQLATENLFLLGGRRRNQLIQSNHTLQFWCSEGFLLAGSSARMCVDGHMDLPLCISEHGQNCRDPPMIENGEIITLSEKQYRPGSSVEYKCQQYYTMEGQNRSFCDNGNWTKVPRCLDPCRISRAEMESHNIEVKERVDELENVSIQRGGSIELNCKTGYSLAKNPSQLVFEFHCDGTLPGIPQCKEIQCLPPQARNGSFQPMQDQYTYNEVIQLECEKGLNFQGQGNISRCTQSGWDPPAICQSGHCNYISIRNGRWYEEKTSLLMKVVMLKLKITHYVCDPGYLTANRGRQQAVRCTESGFDPEPKCFKACRNPIMTHHGFSSDDDQGTFIEGENVTFTCLNPPGQEITAICTEYGWSPAIRCDRFKSD